MQPRAVDVFDCNLEALEASGFRCRDFGGKIAAQVLIDNAIGSDLKHDMNFCILKSACANVATQNIITAQHLNTMCYLLCFEPNY